MAPAEHFVEAHYYAGGLRHLPFGTARRPSWAPAEDSVGFQDEFQLEEGDGAVELRRFELGDRVTWIAVYYRSVDTKLGDRQNHAGVGIWLRNGIVADPAACLYGLSNLAGFLAKNVDTKALGAHVVKFLEPAFLPSYLQTIDAFPFAKGAPWAPPGIVDTQQYFVSCPGGVGECRGLSDYLLNLMLYGADKALQPRSLILVSPRKKPPATARGMTEISKTFDAAAHITTSLPAIFEQITGRAALAEADASQLKARLSELESETQSLRADHQELQSIRDDPLNVVLRRLDEISSRIDNLEGSPRPATAPLHPPTTFIPKRSPVSGTSQSPAEPEYEIDWLKIIVLGALIILIPVLAYLIYDQLAR
jgi:hypothetical protein